MKPIAITDTISKTQAVERINQIVKAHAEMEQRQAADVASRKNEKDLRKAREAEKSDMVIISKDQEKDEQQQKKKQRQRRQPDDDTKREDRTEGGSSGDHLDITA